MNCEKFEARLNELLDQREPLELDAAMRAHQGGCRDCRRLFAAYRKLMHAVRCSASPEPSAKLSERIVEAMLSETMPAAPGGRSTPRGRSWPARFALKNRWVRRAAALAVSVAVLVGVAWHFSSRNLPGPATVQPDEIAGTNATQRVELSALARDATGRYLNLARETQQGMSDALSLLPRVDAPALLDDTVALPRDPTEMAMNVADTLKPLARSTFDTFGFLFGPSRPEKGGM
jgi:hypothetical protein